MNIYNIYYNEENFMSLDKDFILLDNSEYMGKERFEFNALLDFLAEISHIITDNNTKKSHLKDI